MPLKIVRNDIALMKTDAIVNTANSEVAVGPGCDTAIYNAAGYDELLSFRRKEIGEVPEGEIFVTPGFRLSAKYIIHAVSPYYVGPETEDKLRGCYRKSLEKARELGIRSIAFPLIATGGYGYPKEEGLRIAVDEVNAFLLQHEMLVYLVVYGESDTKLGMRIFPQLESFINRRYVEEKYTHLSSPYEDREERDNRRINRSESSGLKMSLPAASMARPSKKEKKRLFDFGFAEPKEKKSDRKSFRTESRREKERYEEAFFTEACYEERIEDSQDVCFDEAHESALEERLKHVSDTFSEYLLYLIEERGMENAEVYKRAIVDKKVFSKIKNNPDYHPTKLTALCLCVGACLNLDETKDLLMRAGYALSPCDKVDIIFTFFIENEIYDMIELDIQLEAYGLPCIIS